MAYIQPLLLSCDLRSVDRVLELATGTNFCGNQDENPDDGAAPTLALSASLKTLFRVPRCALALLDLSVR